MSWVTSVPSWEHRKPPCGDCWHMWTVKRWYLAPPVGNAAAVSAEDIAAIAASAKESAGPKTASKKLVDIGVFLSSEPTIHDLSPELWPSPQLATDLRDERERLRKQGVADPFSFVDLSKKCMAAWAGEICRGANTGRFGNFGLFLVFCGVFWARKRRRSH